MARVDERRVMLAIRLRVLDSLVLGFWRASRCSRCPGGTMSVAGGRWVLRSTARDG